MDEGVQAALEDEAGSIGTVDGQLSRHDRIALLMRILTYEQSADWCKRHGFNLRQVGVLGGADLHLEEPDFHFVMFSITEDAGRRVWLAKFLLGLLEPSVELLMQIGDWSVWPSGQHMPLFDRFRDAFGEHRPLIEAPAHLLGIRERDDAASILIVSVLFLWNCYVLSEKGDEALFVSHDEYGWFAAREMNRSIQVRSQLTEAGVSLLHPPNN